MLKYLRNSQGFRTFRFGLRSLLAALTLVALACWLYWHGWPLYQRHLEQMQFEAAVREEFRPGRLEYDARKFGGLADKIVGYRSDSKGNNVAFIWREWPNACYLIYGLHKPGSGSLQEYVSFDSVEVFRIAPVPPGYRPQTEKGKKYVENSSEPTASLAYWSDFVEMISGDRRDSLGFEYEIIHSVSAEARAEQ